MLKNSTPRQLAFYAATTITGLFLVLALLFDSVTAALEANLLGFLFLSLTCFLGSFLVIFYSLKLFIYRRVKLIYKSIHRLKVVNNDKINSIDMDDDIISEVEKEVVDWAEDKEEEIKSLRSLATYRRHFMGNISHELKTPLFSIQGYLHTLLEGGLYDENINYHYLSRAAKNVDRLQTIVSDLESIARLESGQLILDIQEFDIKSLTMEVFDDLEMRAKEKNIRMILKEGADYPFLVKADRENVRQVLTNLINNSLKYGKEEGQTKVGFYDMDNNILIEVADNGIGIQEKHLPHLFDRFYRVDKSRSRSEGGSGLGLSIVRHIIDAHRQIVNVRSMVDVGSTFGFTLEKAR
ncbi:MAG: HAMP domain-containing sensor histidine kinase [Bacteroidota bacterium]